MPVLDTCIPEGAPVAQRRARTAARITDLVLEHEGVDPIVTWDRGASR